MAAPVGGTFFIDHEEVEGVNMDKGGKYGDNEVTSERQEGLNKHVQAISKKAFGGKSDVVKFVPGEDFWDNLINVASAEVYVSGWEILEEGLECFAKQDWVDGKHFNTGTALFVKEYLCLGLTLFVVI